jgi:CRISPR-associated protein Csm1
MCIRDRLYELLQTPIQHNEVYKELPNQRTAYPEQYKDNIYTVFAGGDDCFFVGGWDTILDWAALVRKEFKEYVIDTKRNIIHPKTGKIPTISAGVVIVDAKFPVIRFAELAEEALSKAKASNRNEQKNKICLFDQVLTWDEFAKAAKWSKDLKGLIENNEKKSMLERIKRSAIGYEKLQEKATTGRISAPKVANLFYYVRRNANENNITLLEDLVTQYTNALLLAFLSSRKGEPIIMNPMLLPIAARWAEFLTRKNTKSDKNGKG